MNNPLDEAFDRLFKEASHRKGVRRFVSSWHKRRMVGAIYAGNYLLMCREFFIAFRLYPLPLCYSVSSPGVREKIYTPSTGF